MFSFRNSATDRSGLARRGQREIRTGGPSASRRPEGRHECALRPAGRPAHRLERRRPCRQRGLRVRSAPAARAPAAPCPPVGPDPPGAGGGRCARRRTGGPAGQRGRRHRSEDADRHGPYADRRGHARPRSGQDRRTCGNHRHRHMGQHAGQRRNGGHSEARTGPSRGARNSATTGEEVSPGLPQSSIPNHRRCARRREPKARLQARPSAQFLVRAPSAGLRPPCSGPIETRPRHPYV